MHSILVKAQVDAKTMAALCVALEAIPAAEDRQLGGKVTTYQTDQAQ